MFLYHASQRTHNIDWNNVNILANEDQRTSKHSREAIHIRKGGDNTMNRDEGQHFPPRSVQPYHP